PGGDRGRRGRRRHRPRLIRPRPPGPGPRPPRGAAAFFMGARGGRVRAAPPGGGHGYNAGFHRPVARSMALDPLDLYDVRSLLSEEERAVQDTVARFTDERVLPIIGECFDEGRFPKELIPEIAGLGLLGATLPPEYGGAGLNYVSYGLICQELERGDSGLRSFASVQSSLCMYPIFAYGTEEQKQRWLPDMAAGKVIGCFGLTEPHGGSDPANMKTHARRDGDDWVINGSKMWITNGNLADIAIVWAQTDDGIQGFVVEKDFAGFKAQVVKHKMSL